MLIILTISFISLSVHHLYTIVVIVFAIIYNYYMPIEKYDISAVIMGQISSSCCQAGTIHYLLWECYVIVFAKCLQSLLHPEVDTTPGNIFWWIHSWVRHYYYYTYHPLSSTTPTPLGHIIERHFLSDQFSGISAAAIIQTVYYNVQLSEFTYALLFTMRFTR